MIQPGSGQNSFTRYLQPEDCAESFQTRRYRSNVLFSEKIEDMYQQSADLCINKEQIKPKKRIHQLDYNLESALRSASKNQEEELPKRAYLEEQKVTNNDKGYLFTPRITTEEKLNCIAEPGPVNPKNSHISHNANTLASTMERVLLHDHDEVIYADKNHRDIKLHQTLQPLSQPLRFTDKKGCAKFPAQAFDTSNQPQTLSKIQNKRYQIILDDTLDQILSLSPSKSPKSSILHSTPSESFSNYSSEEIEIPIEQEEEEEKEIFLVQQVNSSEESNHMKDRVEASLSEAAQVQTVEAQAEGEAKEVKKKLKSIGQYYQPKRLNLKQKFSRGSSEKEKGFNGKFEREDTQKSSLVDTFKPTQNESICKINTCIKSNLKYETPPKLKFSSQKIDIQKAIPTNLSPQKLLKNISPQKATLPCSAKVQPYSQNSTQKSKNPAQKIEQQDQPCNNKPCFSEVNEDRSGKHSSIASPIARLNNCQSRTYIETFISVQEGPAELFPNQNPKVHNHQLFNGSGKKEQALSKYIDPLLCHQQFRNTGCCTDRNNRKTNFNRDKYPLEGGQPKDCDLTPRKRDERLYRCVAEALTPNRHLLQRKQLNVSKNTSKPKVIIGDFQDSRFFEGTTESFQKARRAGKVMQKLMETNSSQEEDSHDAYVNSPYIRASNFRSQK
ncbi:unnamed protein product [Moneuplotes crassus]|uniref:Uncharacterized protein n=1 Tax=Euplotes crassus TaxID=5936 RepID=A0AAD1XIH6_EUPCR|nr:unnamed protein product [Moneuplotes crassus]